MTTSEIALVFNFVLLVGLVVMLLPFPNLVGI